MSEMFRGSVDGYSVIKFMLNRLRRKFMHVLSYFNCKK